MSFPIIYVANSFYGRYSYSFVFWDEYCISYSYKFVGEIIVVIVLCFQRKY